MPVDTRPPNYYKGHPCPYASVYLICQEDACEGCMIYLDRFPNTHNQEVKDRS